MTEISVTLEEVRRAEENRQELTYYQERGRLIQDKCRDYCAHILNKVDELYSEDKDPLPFICVEGSSGMGKSQLAFALEGRRPYFYWLATTLDPVLKGSTTIFVESNAFCEMKDNPTKKSEDEILNTSSKVYRNGLLWTYGFLGRCLNIAAPMGIKTRRE
ncbi:hypothetical protein Plhal304r1_c054g0138701 [Plasmopara halstedii]